MRVLFVTHRLPYPADRGDRIRSNGILRALAPHADVDLISLIYHPEERLHATALRDITSTVTTALVPKVSPYLRAVRALATVQPLTHALLHSPEVKPALERVMSTHRPDVVLAYGSGMVRFILESRLSELPCVLDMVDVDSEKWRALSRSALRPWRWIYAREAVRLAAYEARAARQVTVTVVVNEREQAALRRLAPDVRVEVIPIGVDFDRFHPAGPPVDQPDVIFSGVMNYLPNEEAAIWVARAVWPLVRAHRPEARLWLVGADPSRRVSRLAARDPSIVVTGTVADVRPFLWRSALAVAPLLTARGVQTKVLEAVAAGLPTVVTPAVLEGLPKEIVPACLAATTAEGFARRIVHLLGLSGAERRALAGRAQVSSLSWSAQLAPLVGILEHAAQRRSVLATVSGSARAVAQIAR